jgi:hypothetical protein
MLSSIIDKEKQPKDEELGRTAVRSSVGRPLGYEQGVCVAVYSVLPFVLQQSDLLLRRLQRSNVGSCHIMSENLSLRMRMNMVKIVCFFTTKTWKLFL